MFFNSKKHLEAEKKNFLDIEHVGIVVSNADPQKMGRCKVIIDPFEDLTVDQLPWCNPMLPHFLGLTTQTVCFSVPIVGSSVLVSFPTKEKYSPEYSLASPNTQNFCHFFDEDYPNSYGMIDHKNNFIKVNTLQRYIQIQHGSGTNVIFGADGSLITTLADGTIIQGDSNGNVNITTKNINLNASSSINMTAPTINITGADITLDGNVDITSGATGEFTTADQQIVTVSNGVTTNINQ